VAVMWHTVIEHDAFLFKPKLRTKMNQPPVRGGVELQSCHAIMWEEGVWRSNTTEARLIDRTTHSIACLMSTKSYEITRGRPSMGHWNRIAVL
jgi:hypothetical protein